MSRSPTRIAYRVAEVAELTGLNEQTIYRLTRKRTIPTMGNVGACVLIPAWALDAWAATGDWRHPDWRPVPPGADLDPAADVIPLHSDAS